MSRPPVSSIYSRGPSPCADPDARRRDFMAECWHRHGIAVLHPDDIDDEWMRQAVINEAERLYGRRNP